MHQQKENKSVCGSESEQAYQRQEQLLTSLGTELAHNKQKVADYRNQCQMLRQDLKLANKVSTPITWYIPLCSATFELVHSLHINILNSSVYYHNYDHVWLKREVHTPSSTRTPAPVYESIFLLL